MNIMHKLAENAIGTILAGSDDWIDDDQYHEFEGDYDWSDDDICTLYFRVDGKYIGSWDVDIADIEDINTLDSISAEVEAAVSGMSIRKTVIEENWQDDWVEPTIDPNPIDNVNGLDIYKGTDQYGEKAYYLFLEDEEYPEPGYEEWQAETLEIAREWASSYETVEADDFVEEDLLVRGSDGELTNNTNSGRWGNSKEWDYNNAYGKKKESVKTDDFDDEIGPNAYKYVFKALDKGYWDDLEWLDVKYYDGKLCRVIGTPIAEHDFKSSYHDIEFEDGTELSAISGIHLLPVNKRHNPHFTESIARKVEGATKMFVKNGAIIHNAGQTLEVLDQNSDDTLLVGLNKDGSRQHRYIVAWGLQSDGSWNQGHYFFDEEEARKSFDERAKDSKSISVSESNGVSRNIPSIFDNFLQDVAQITGTISYSDIMNFKYTERDKSPLNKLKMAWYDALDDDADDEILQDIGSKVADYIKNKLKSERYIKIKVI